MNNLPFETYLYFFSILFILNTGFLFFAGRLTEKNKLPLLQAGILLAFILSLFSLFFTFRYHFEQYSERMNQFYLPTFFAVIFCIIILGIGGYITDRKSNWSLYNGLLLLPLSLILVYGGIDLVRIRIIFWVLENPGPVITSLILFFWLFLVIGFFEILSSSDWLFIIALIFYNSTLKVLFYYMDFPPVLLNDFMLMFGLILLASKVFNPAMKAGSTLSLPLGLIQALIPVITRLKRFTFITFISPFFLVTMIIIIIFINFFWRSILFRGPQKV